MSRAHALSAALTLLAGCAVEADAPVPAAAGGAITQLTGALLLHQFPAGAHASLTVVDPPQPLAELMGRDPFSLPFAPALREGACILSLSPRCAPACPDGRYCSAPDTCAPLVPLRNIDLGEVQVTGSRAVPLIRLWLRDPARSYDADPPPGATLLFLGGEPLVATGGQGPYAFRASLSAPQPVELLEPPSGPLRLPLAGPLALRWRPAGAAQMVLLLSASRQDRGWGSVRCLLPDSGEFALSAALLARLPPPPRTVHLELERDEERLAPNRVGPGVGMLVHAAYSVWLNGAD